MRRTELSSLIPYSVWKVEGATSRRRGGAGTRPFLAEVEQDASTVGDALDHLAQLGAIGEPAADRPPLVRLHSDCLSGDVASSARCDCG